MGPTALRHRIQGKPRRPVPAELEEVIVVYQTPAFERRDKLRQRVRLEHRSNRDDVSFDPELLVREIEKRVDLSAGEARRLERRPTDDQARGRVSDSKWHGTNIGFEEWVRVSSSGLTSSS